MQLQRQCSIGLFDFGQCCRSWRIVTPQHSNKKVQAKSWEDFGNPKIEQTTATTNPWPQTHNDWLSTHRDTRNTL
jgi:hypothetical protein